MPFVEVFTRETLSNTVMTVEVGGPTGSAKMIAWMNAQPSAKGCSRISMAKKVQPLRNFDPTEQSFHSLQLSRDARTLSELR